MGVDKLGAALLRRAHDADGLEDFRRQALLALRQLVPADTAEFVPFQPGAWPIVAIDIDDDQRRWVEHCENNRTRYAADISNAANTALVHGGLITTEIFSLKERTESAFFREVVKVRRISCQLCLLPRWRGVPLGFMTLTRYGRGSAFSSRQLNATLALVPVIGLGLAALSAGSPPHETALTVLTARELEIARHVMQGLSTREVACLLGTSPFTVRNQLSRIFEKTGVLNRAELASWLARRE